MGQGGGNAGTVGGEEPPGAAATLPRTWSIRIENPALISFAGISKQVRKKDVIERKNLISMRKKHVAAGPGCTCDMLFQLNCRLDAQNDVPGIPPKSGHGEISQMAPFKPPDRRYPARFRSGTRERSGALGLPEPECQAVSGTLSRS